MHSTSARRIVITFERCFKYSYHNMGTRTVMTQPLECKGIVQEKNQDTDSLERFKWMKQMGPCFPVNSSKIKILENPCEFYDKLMEEARKAKKRITIASLYLGITDMEKDLLSSIEQSIKKSNVKVNMLFDHQRGSRGKNNSRQMLLPLLQEYPNQVEVSLYHSPHLRGIIKDLLPDRMSETIQLSHLKVYLFDDTIILSGANLNDDYFTNRQDRYVAFNNCHNLANYFSKLVTNVGKFSFKLGPDDNLSLHPMWKIHPFLDEKADFLSEANKKLKEMVEYKVQEEDENTDTWIFPLLQMKTMGINQDEEVTKKLFKMSSPECRIKLASGYFNMTDEFIFTLCHYSKGSFDILTASPEVNGFFGAQGIAGYIPDVYTYLSKRFCYIVNRNNLSQRVKLFEYYRNKWTFHVKGMWYYLPGHHLPSLTLIGSPNFGYRSVYRDLECQVAIVTENKDLQVDLHKEQERLFASSKPVTKSTFDQPKRQTPFIVKVLSPFIKGFF